MTDKQNSKIKQIMKKFLFTLISILSLCVILPELKAGSVNSRNTKDLVKIPFKNDKNKNLSKLTRKKLKKIVRKAGRGYRTVKPGR